MCTVLCLLALVLNYWYTVFFCITVPPWYVCVSAMGVVSRTYFVQSTGIIAVICTNCFVMLCFELQKQPTRFRMKQSYPLFMAEQVTQHRVKKNNVLFCILLILLL